MRSAPHKKAQSTQMFRGFNTIIVKKWDNLCVLRA